MATDRFSIYLIKPTRYDDDGYLVQWWRSLVPSNALACVSALVDDCLSRDVLPGVAVRTVVLDEIHTRIDPGGLIRDIKRQGGRAVVFLVGVQTNQFPRAADIARPLRAAGIPVCVGGFHVSGCLSMLKDLPPDLVEAQARGISFFAGEAEEQRLDEVLQDAFAGTLKPIYNHVKDTPNLAGAPVPHLAPEIVAKNLSGYTSFDLGRGCPFECSFCTIINVQGRKSRFRSVEDLEKIIRDNAAQGITRFFLTDDNFARNRNWKPFLERLAHLRQSEKIDVRLVMQVDVLAHKIDGFVDACIAAGLDQMFIGLENINSDNLEGAKKRQNRIEDYREMFLTWRKHPIVIVCGYIIGFANDTKASILRDMEVLKKELAVDLLYMNYLTPLPGSEDHRTMLNAGIWMDPDMNKYDLNHRVTHHPRMSDQDWEAAYREAHASFYSFDHMKTVIRRLVALGSNKRLTTAKLLTGYREMVLLEGVAKLEGGLFRIKRRRQRRPGLPLENPLVFYSRYALQQIRAVTGIGWTYWRLRRFAQKVWKDPDRYAYRDVAITPVGEEIAPLAIMVETRGNQSIEDRRHRKALYSTAPSGAATSAGRVPESTAY
jgi:hypothetical protein